MDVRLVNGWWITTDSGGQMGGTDSAHVGQKQIENASAVYVFLNHLGWSLSAIAGAIGNMQLESFLSPGYIEGVHRSRLPNSAASLSDVPNSVMINFYKDYYQTEDSEYGIGIVQWNGKTDTPPVGQKLVSFAERHGWSWWEGDIQMARIQAEQAGDFQWRSYTINGILWTWDNYPTNDQTPEVSAHVWQACYEQSDPGTLPTREGNARFWYDYFTNNPPTPPHRPLPGWMYEFFQKQNNKQSKNRKVRT